MEIEEIRSHFPAVLNNIYMNTGSYGPLSLEVEGALRNWISQQVERGSANPKFLRDLMASRSRTRGKLAEMIGAKADEITLTRSTTEGMSLVARGFRWREGDEVITSNLEYPSGIVPWLYLQKEEGIRVRVVDLLDHGDVAGRVRDAITSRTRLICLSHITYNTGEILPVEEVAEVARLRGIPFLVDGAQAVGHISVDVKAIGCDFYSFPGHKWLLGPIGTGALYGRAEMMERLTPLEFGSGSVEEYDLREKLRLKSPPHRFEAGSGNFVDFAGLEASLDFLARFDRRFIWERIHNLAGLLRESVKKIPKVKLISPEGWGSCGFVSLGFDDRDPEEVVKKLGESISLISRSVPSPKAMRLSVHFFNTEGEVEEVARSLRELLAR
ncbi:MAG: aminotransferase class V-fold PLP-dependent enzyme [bacterium]